MTNFRISLARASILALAMVLVPLVEAGDTRLLPETSGEQDFFGFATAVDGDRLVSSSRGDDELGPDVGAVTVFERVDGIWERTATLRPEGASDGALFGMAVALEGDVLVVGAFFENERGREAGAAYVFEYDGSTWQSTAKLLGDETSPFDWFGVSCAIDAGRIVVGARQDHGGAFMSGAAYVFEKVDGTWSQTARLTAASPWVSGNFGHAVDISGDAILVGEFNGQTGPGRAHLFEWNGEAWAPTLLTPSDSQIDDMFGVAVALDGGTALVGSRMHDGAAINTGAVFVYERQAPATWGETAILTSPSPRSRSEFGNKVDLEGDVALIGEWEGGGPLPGASHVFRRIEGAWRSTAELQPDYDGTGGGFGHDVAMDGSTAVVGAFLQDDPVSDAGGTYVYDLSAPLVAAYGTGWPGTNGTPELRIDGVPAPGQALSLHLSNTSGASTRCLLARGSEPAEDATRFGGTLLLVPVVVEAREMPASGFGRELAVPDRCEWIGRTFRVQGFVRDDGASDGWAFSNAVEITIGR